MTMQEIMERFDAGAEEILADPEGFRQQVEAELIAERGREWFEEHKNQIAADWEQVRALMGI